MTAATPGREPSARAAVPGVDDLWRRLKRDGNPEARDGLILHYAPVVKFVAGRLRGGLPATVESQDLMSYGTIGLIDAIDKFDPERGLRFEAYAVTRIRGAIIDELRRLDWVPRSVRARAREIQEALATAEHRLGRSVSEAELASELGVDTAALQRSLDDVAAGGVLALDDSGDDGPRLHEVLVDPGADPAGHVERGETRRILVEAVKALPERERHVVALYYFESLTLARIADILQVTESRVSQIHTKAVLSLRNRLTLATRDR